MSILKYRFSVTDIAQEGEARKIILNENDAEAMSEESNLIKNITYYFHHFNYPTPDDARRKLNHAQLYGYLLNDY